jgi:hypothetical protein
MLAALQVNERWALRFNVMWFSIVGFWLADPALFFMGMYLLTEYVDPAIAPRPA